MRDNPKRTGRRMKSARIKAGLTQAKVAESLDTSRTYVYMLESGRRLNPSLDVLRKWAKACGVTLGEML